MENKTYKIFYTWKMILISFLCLLLGAVAFRMAISKSWSYFRDIFMGVAGVAFFLVGLFMIIYIIYSYIYHIPVFEICEDRIKMHSLFKNKHVDLMFEDVENFQLYSYKHNQQIRIIYTNSGYSKLVEKSGIVKKKLIKFNVGLTGNVGSLNVSNMSMKPKEIQAILAEQLRKYKE